MSRIQSSHGAPPKDQIIAFAKLAGGSIGEGALVALALSLMVVLAWLVTLGVALVLY
jgi:hypothetical protein